jgi:cell division protein FtsQ
MSTAVQKTRKSKGVKRRYDVALNMEGAEIRLPSIPNIAIGWRLLSALLVAALGFAVYTIVYSPIFQVAELEVEGLRRLTWQDINAVSNVLGESILYVDPEQMQVGLLAAFPDLESVSVEVGLPANVTVTAVERHPVVAWEKDGNTVWVDSTGVAFPPRGDSGPKVKVVAENLPTVVEDEEAVEAGDIRTEMLPVQLIEAVLAMAEQAPKDTPIVYDELHGLGWQDNLGWVVYFGKDTQEMEMKLRVYEVLARRLKKQDPRPELVSVEFLHAPYYRMER